MDTLLEHLDLAMPEASVALDFLRIGVGLFSYGCCHKLPQI